MPIDTCIEKVDLFLQAKDLPKVQMFRYILHRTELQG